MPLDAAGGGASPAVLIACDKFRGSLTAAEANSAIARGIGRVMPNATTVAVPIADGGEGTLAALTLHDTHIRHANVEGPFGAPITVPWSLDPDSGLAVVELAAAAGHHTLNGAPHDPDRASSYGVGQMIAEALDAGARTIVVALGGSVTVDAGAGALEALGAALLDKDGAPIPRAAGRALSDVVRVDRTALHPALSGAMLVLASDVDNPLCGPNGAAAVFGPQKGVQVGDIDAFNASLARFDGACAESVGAAPLRDTPFAGAAGGMMVGLRAAAEFLSAQDGFAIMAERRGLSALVDAADWVVTGEGSMDGQSLSGKGPVALARLALEAGKPALGFVGRRAVDYSALHAEGFAAVFPISPEPQSLADALAGAPEALEQAAAHAFGLIAAAQPKTP